MDDYEKKYKEALERAVLWHKSVMPADKKAMVEDLFPELKESEDERIRKAIIAYIDHGQHNGISNKDMVAWLEKQKSQKDKGEISASVNVRKKKATGVLGEMIANINPESLQKTKEQMIAEVEQQIKGGIGMILTGVNERRFEDFGATLKECLEWLEKQGKKLDANEVIGWLNHRELSCDDVVTTVIPDDNPTSIHHKVKWLSDEFIKQFKEDFGL